MNTPWIFLDDENSMFKRRVLACIMLMILVVLLAYGFIYAEYQNSQQRYISANEVELVRQWIKEYPQLTDMVRTCLKYNHHNITRECFDQIEEVHRFNWMGDIISGKVLNERE